MKLKNKQTGEIKDWDFGDWYQVILNPENKEKYECNISEFMDRTVKFREEWEDVPEEPKKYWYIDPMVCGAYHTKIEKDEDLYDFNKQIGNYFETKEEAKKAVERLRAWKRLKDFGCGFMLDDHFTVKFVGPDARKITSAEGQKSLSDAYKLLFGGEE